MILATRLLLLLFLATFTNSISPSFLLAFNEPMQSIKTGNITGVYYSAGSAVAKMHNRKLKEYNLRLIAEASEGSVSNIDDVANGLASFGIAQANALYFAKNGKHYWQDSPQDKLRSVLGLYTEAFTIVAAVDADINSLADLKGKTVNIGELGSTDSVQATSILKTVGLDLEKDLTISEKPTYEASELLQQGDIDAYFYTVGHPNLSIKEASHGDRKIMIVAPDQELIDSISQREDLVDMVIPIDYYTELANKEPIHSIGVKAILFCNSDADKEVVYHIVKEVFENFELFKQQHPAFANLTPEKLSTGLIVPLHPGAERYFKEAGLLR
ncbi:MAG: TAXI family TRAP transporter solute-binding subunit [Desulfuromonadales bacterium]|nr:TAXI family TRAP transporter solute-binding subunit [Desulfuromonadales bacterium]